MKHGSGAKRITVLLVLAMFAGVWVGAQAAPQPAPPDQSQNQKKPAQQPSTTQPSTGGGSQANPFPTDTNSVPVLPSSDQPAVPESSTTPEPAPALPGGDVDPVRSPDEPIPDTSSSGSSGSSSSSADIANIVAPPPDEDTGKSQKGNRSHPPQHTETAQEDESVGSYCLDQKNWRAALSRFQSALVLDPDNPDVYWGLAEAQRHLGDAAHAKANYRKVIEYDPDSRHGKDSKKLLKDPEMAGK